VTEPVLIVPDVHRPFHNKKAWGLMLKVARQLRPKHIVTIGDFADCYAVSDHDKSPRRANRFEEEVADAEDGLDELDALGATNKLYIAGNHEDRLTRYLMKHQALWGVVSIPKLFRLQERGWKYTPYKHHTRIGKVFFTHDVGVASRNAIFRSLDLYQHSVVTGHTHRFASVVEGTALGKACKGAWSFGWLGNVEAVEYMCLAKARASWALGFGIGQHDPDTGYMYMTPIPILPDYSCCVNGKVVRA
jgi:hypothetical protein